MARASLLLPEELRKQGEGIWISWLHLPAGLLRAHYNALRPGFKHALPLTRQHMPLQQPGARGSTRRRTLSIDGLFTSVAAVMSLDP